MPTWDYMCESCGKKHPSVFYQGRKPTTIPCECGAEAEWDYNHSKAQIHLTRSSGNYGKVDPQTGLVYEDYSDRKNKLKAHGYEETDHFTEEEIREQQWEKRQNANKPGDSDGVISAETIEELQTTIDGNTHKAKQGEMLESWVSL